MQTLATLVPLAGVGIALISIVCPLAVVVGIGGGGLFVPILILFMRFSTHEATVMSQSLIFGGTIAALLLNLKSRHPLMPNKPLIDVNLVLLMGPTQLIGIQIGAIINKLLPSFVLLAFLSLILAVSAFKLWKKGKMVMKKERLAASSSAEPSTNSAITRSPSQHSSLVISLEEKQVEREYSLKPIVDESADKTTACHEETHTLSEKIQTTSSPFPVHAISVPIDHLSQSTMPLRMDTTVVDSVKERCKNNVEKKKSSQFLHVGLAPSFSRSHIQGMQRMLTTESATPSSLSHIRGSAEEVTPRHKQKKWEFLKKMSSSHGSPEGMELPSETNLVVRNGKEEVEMKG
ncbi:hypothetical protein IE077_002842 [Cardiosporidium cionae]|uniref:Uncharacterized protein n=1 Tax=Cardiosporidium cionae TaxID=476202 RepID=A0ABQ7J9T1_9APIC|nr:hypothetical protein IE077_002842 [Cardiosporidium cionae]|eukprot:KAF8820751.1 hypothetical protein IE077_002842 [Cardiosporidium cionae]